MTPIMRRQQAIAQPKQKRDLLGPLTAIAGGAAAIAAPGAGTLAMTAGGLGATGGLMSLAKKPAQQQAPQEQSRVVPMMERRQMDIAQNPSQTLKEGLLALQQAPQEMRNQYMAPLAQAYMLDLNKRSMG